ncbi:MAG: Crp/Fnr family transcriptional regulator [Cyclobacteriaceae bacterium]
MNASNILDQISRHISLDERESLYFTSLLIPAKIKQGEYVEKIGSITQNFIYVESGCLMSYSADKKGDLHVIQFSTAGWWTGDLQSFTKKQPAIYSTRALAESAVFYLPKTDMDQLLDRYPKFEKYFRILFQNALITQLDRIIQNFSIPAEDRYERFRQKYPTFEQYVPLKYIASYLGITPEFLSKIRRRQTEK